MTDQFDTESIESEGLRAHVKKLEADAAAAKAATEKAQALERELAFERAGIPSEGAGTYFRKGYEGEMDHAAIRQAAIEAGIVQTAAPAQPQADPVAHQQMSQLVQTGEPPAPLNVDAELEKAAAEGPEAFEQKIDQLGLRGTYDDVTHAEAMPWAQAEEVGMNLPPNMVPGSS